MTETSDMDLNLDNYTFHDILNLFDLPVLYTVDELRIAKRIVANTHPDKSSLPTEYFIFFKTAYQLLLDIYRQRERKERTVEMLESERYCDNIPTDDGSGDLPPKGTTSDTGKFNKWFNRMFDESVDIGTADDGHGDWLKEPDPIDSGNSNKTFQEMERVIHTRKKQSAIAVVDDIQEYGFGSSVGYSELVGVNHIVSGGGGSTIQYDDVRRAYTESIIPVDESVIMARRTNHKDVTSLVKERGNLPKILDRSVSEKMLIQKRNVDSTNDTYRLYELTKEDDRSERTQKAWKANLLRIGF